MSGFPLALPPFLLRVDRLVVSRRTPHMDATGNDDSTPVVVPTITRGTFANVTDKDITKADERSSSVDAIVAFAPGTDIRDGDFISVRNLDYEVVAVEDARNRVRAHVRRYLIDSPDDDTP